MADRCRFSRIRACVAARRARDGAGDLRRRNPRREERERHRRVIAGLLLKGAPVDGGGQQAWRGAGLEAAELQTQAIEALGQAKRGGFAHTAGGDLLLPEVDEAVEEGAGGEHDGARAKLAAIG